MTTRCPRRLLVRRFAAAVLHVVLALGIAMPAAARSFSDERSGRSGRETEFARLVSYRFEAIETAFGTLSGVLDESIRIRIVRKNDEDFAQLGGIAIYDRSRRQLVFPQSILYQVVPNPLQWANLYWPFYQDENVRRMFPIIEVIDNVLWDAYLKESAGANGGQWPPPDCVSPDVSKRLPCGMVVRGMLEHIKQVKQPLFNENRLDKVWPESFSDFSQRVLHTASREYIDAERYGGILLLKPLIVEFGVPRAFAYAARTPFRVDGNNVRLSALRYQEQARAALAW